MSVVHEFKVEMTCGGCSNAVQKVLGKLGDKIEELNIDLNTRTVFVKSAMSGEELLEIIQKTGKTSRFGTMETFYLTIAVTYVIFSRIFFIIKFLTDAKEN